MINPETLNIFSLPSLELSQRDCLPEKRVIYFVASLEQTLVKNVTPLYLHTQAQFELRTLTGETLTTIYKPKFFSAIALTERISVNSEILKINKNSNLPDDITPYPD